MNSIEEISSTDVVIVSEEETKHYLTPFAFKLDKSLLGLPLASPAKRGIALIIDFSLIALLSDISGVALALAIAITFYYLGNKKRAEKSGKTTGHKRRKTFRIIAAIMVFFVLLDTLPPLLTYFNGQDTEASLNTADNSLALSESVLLAALLLSAVQTIDDSSCQQFDCWQTELGAVAEQVALVNYEGNIKITLTQLDNIFSGLAQEIALTVDEQAQLLLFMQASYKQKLASLEEETIAENQLAVDMLKEKDFQTQVTTLPLTKDEIVPSITSQPEQQTVKKPVYSIIEWVKAIIEDLGLGFGWATFYFTAFIALGQGQTLGKKLLGIRVLQLDGTPLSFWDSFGRYGGYGAGLATGLLGFIQIYWDANRQAIHDKISATVVIDIRKSRLTRSSNEQDKHYSS